MCRSCYDRGGDSPFPTKRSIGTTVSSAYRQHKPQIIHHPLMFVKVVVTVVDGVGLGGWLVVPLCHTNAQHNGSNICNANCILYPIYYTSVRVLSPSGCPHCMLTFCSESQQSTRAQRGPLHPNNLPGILVCVPVIDEGLGTAQHVAPNSTGDGAAGSSPPLLGVAL